MKTVFLTLGFILFLSSLDGQTLYKQKKKRKDFFGKAENPNDKVRPIGIQFQIGPTYTFTRTKNDYVQGADSLANRFRYLQDPNGRLGIFAEIGLVHFNMKDPKIKKFGRIVDYIDYGVGFKLFGGRETTTIDALDASGNVTASETGEGSFYNGYIYGRFAVHKLQYLNKTKKIFLDHSLGINGNYLVTGGDKNYKAPVFEANQYFSKPFMLQLHYDIGFGIRIKKGSYLIPGVQLPFLGLHEWNKGNPSIRWYSSKYYPALFHIKFIKLLPAKKGKGCYEGDPADRKRNEEYMQNK